MATYAKRIAFVRYKYLEWGRVVRLALLTKRLKLSEEAKYLRWCVL